MPEDHPFLALTPARPEGETSAGAAPDALFDLAVNRAAAALRGARANVVGLVGLVENMPDGNAQRPGDVVVSLNGRDIESSTELTRAVGGAKPGDTLRLEAEFGRGWPENPADMQDIRDKFLRCCEQSPNHGLRNNARRLMACIENLIEAPSLQALLAATREGR